LDKVSAIVPAYNEADTIIATLKALGRVEEIKEVIVVDDGSIDGTNWIAERLADRVIRLEKNYGKGEAVWLGVRAATFPIVALLDADLGFSVMEVRHLLPPVLNGEVDMSVAVFPKNRAGSGFGMVKKVAGWGMYIFTRNYCQEPLSGQRVLRKEIFGRMKTPPRGFGLEIALSLEAWRQNFRVKEVGVNMYHREKGRNIAGWVHRSRQMVAVLRELFREAVLR